MRSEGSELFEESRRESPQFHHQHISELNKSDLHLKHSSTTSEQVRKKEEQHTPHQEEVEK